MLTIEDQSHLDNGTKGKNAQIKESVSICEVTLAIRDLGRRVKSHRVLLWLSTGFFNSTIFSTCH